MLHLINNKMSTSTNKNKLIGIETIEPIYYTRGNLDGTLEYVFVLNTLHTLDSVFINQDKMLADGDMREFFERYTIEADGELSELMKQFDKYLGGYLGVENLVYTTKNVNSGRENEYTIVYS